MKHFKFRVKYQPIASKLALEYNERLYYLAMIGEMMENNVCLNCGLSEQEKPLLTIKYQRNEIYICPQCLPVLIHKPANLADKLPGAESFGAPAENHH
jgi:hypothetical protein